MKKINKLFIVACGLGLMTSCMDLDLSPLAEATNENWYADENQVEMSVNDLYRQNVWRQLPLFWNDDLTRRNELNDLINGGLNGELYEVTETWKNYYQIIGRDNAVIDKLKAMPDDFMDPAKRDQYLAECLFIRACAYSRLTTLFGDVPYTETTIDIETGLTMGRTPKAEVLQKIYADFDYAIENLPVETGSIQRATKGAAYGMKARIALYNEDWKTAITCAKACMDLGVYDLYSSYRDLFLQSTHNTVESVFSIPRSLQYTIRFGWQDYLPRNNGGWAANSPTWDLLAAYLCTDGLPIDESPLFDPHDPFKNRDPRLSMTIVPFGENWCGVEYNPHPEALEVMDYSTGQMITNNDTRANAQYASYDGLVWKKGLDESCLNNAMRTEADRIIIRYADVLLMYAEAKIELNQIDQSVLDAMNEVRARAYGVDKSATEQYPAFKMASQQELRKQLRMERRMEFPKEGLRYMDLIRWKLMDKVMTKKVYMMLYPSTLLIENVVNTGDWFWAFTPEIDENGLADFSALEAAGKIAVVAQKNWNERQYLWPIPTTEILINPNMKQNPGY